MSSGSAVFKTGRLGTPDLQRFKVLIPEAVTRAIYTTQRELEPFYKNPSIVPFKTGLLQGSVVSFVSPGQITIQWSAIDKGFDYAKIQDEGGPTRGSGYITGKGFSGFMLQKAKEILIKNLTVELQNMQP